MTDSYKLLLTNARSLSPKIESLHNTFEAHMVDVALITESWLKDGSVLDGDVCDLEHGTGLKIIYKNRPKSRASARRVGGGVTIIYDSGKCCFRERKIAGNKFELVAAVGRIGRIERDVAIYCVYIEPRTRVGELRELEDLLSRDILQLKAKGDPLVFVGGDFNRRRLELGDFDDIKQVNFLPTRGDACLDVMMTNAQLTEEATWPPLATRQGITSDHNCTIISGSEVRKKNFVWLKKTTRKHTAKGVRQFGEELRGTDWNAVLHSQDPDELVEAFEAYTGSIVDRLFPLRTVRYRSNEKPWITDGIRKLARSKRRVYRREGKSRLWIRLRDELEQRVEMSQSEYIDKVESQGPKAHFATIKKMCTVVPAKEWSVSNLFPEASSAEAGDKIAQYFTRISDDFVPLQPSRTAQETRPPLPWRRCRNS